MLAPSHVSKSVKHSKVIIMRFIVPGPEEGRTNKWPLCCLLPYLQVPTVSQYLVLPSVLPTLNFPQLMGFHTTSFLSLITLLCPLSFVFLSWCLSFALFCLHSLVFLSSYPHLSHGPVQSAEPVLATTFSPCWTLPLPLAIHSFRSSQPYLWSSYVYTSVAKTPGLYTCATTQLY